VAKSHHFDIGIHRDASGRLRIAAAADYRRSRPAEDHARTTFDSNDAGRRFSVFYHRLQEHEFELSGAAIKGRSKLPLADKRPDDFPGLFGSRKMLLHFEVRFAALDGNFEAGCLVSERAGLVVVDCFVMPHPIHKDGYVRIIHWGPPLVDSTTAASTLYGAVAAAAHALDGRGLHRSFCSSAPNCAPALTPAQYLSSADRPPVDKRRASHPASAWALPPKGASRARSPCLSNTAYPPSGR
jgi:hypothetical protein